MKLSVALAAAGFAATSRTLASPAPAQGVAVVVGDPGPGWTRWHDHRFGRGWDGPNYFSGRGEHHGWYRWNNNYYRNCSWRGPDRHREWRCW
jgi:hypothetical protein